MEEKKLIGEQNGNANNNNDNVNTNDEKDYRMKFLKWSPDWLQRFNTINWFLFVLSLASITQGIIVNGLSVVSLPTIEKEFGLSSKSAGLIVAGNDASALLLVGLVSFFGAKAHKPRWMAIGVLVTGLGSLLFAAPKLMVETYRPLKPSEMALDICSTNKAMKVLDCTQSGSTLYVAVLFLAQFIMGAGITPLFTLGPAFLDENVSPKASPIYLGIWFASTMLGPGLGFLIGGQYLQIFTNIEKPANITPKDPQWIGAWWLGFVTLSILFFLCGFLMLLFPKVIPSCQEKRRKAVANGAIPKADPTIEFTIKGYIMSSIKICFNKIFMCTVFAMTVKTLYIIGLASFLVKILVVKFGISPYKVSTMLGIMMVPSMFIGIIGGAFIMRRFNINVAAKSAAKFCLIVTVVQLPAAFVYLLPGCNNTNLAGKMVPYHNQTEIGESLYSQCNSKCMCTNKIYIPVCGSDDITYQSPCFAGCSVTLLGKDDVPFFGNCTCLPPMKSGDRMKMSKRKTNIQLPKDLIKLFSKRGNTTINPEVLRMQMQYMASTLYNQVSIGSCDRDCKNFIVFVLIVMGTIIFSFLSGTPHKMLILRSVPDNQRSFALGIQFLIMRSLSFLPGPIIMGAVVDSQCITWMYDKCGAKTNCADYDIGNLSRNLTLFALISSGGAAIFYGLAVFLFPRSADDADSKPMSALIAEQEAEDTKA